MLSFAASRTAISGNDRIAAARLLTDNVDRAAQSAGSDFQKVLRVKAGLSRVYW
jgi:NAD-dependent SIR2 family protein deacetylase